MGGRMRYSLHVTLVAAAVCAGCDGEPQPVTQSPSDSAGVRIVVAEDPGVRLTLGAVELEVGGREADGHDLYRVGAGLLDPGDGVVVLDRGSNEVRYFSESGDLTHTLGGEGDGPGEFRAPYLMQWIADGRLVVGDLRHRRATVFGSDRDVVESVSIDLPLQVPDRQPDVRMPPAVVGFTADGGMVGLPSPQIELTGRPGPLPIRAPLRVYGPDQAVRSEVADVRLMEYFETPGEGMGMEWVPGSPVFRYAASGARVALSDGGAHDIAVVDDGVMTLRIRESRSRLVFEPDSVVGAIPPADSLPSYDELAVDADQRVWARAGARVDAQTRIWRLFSAEGDFVGSLELGERDRVLDAAGERVLLLRFDSLDVETVELRRFDVTNAGGPSP